MAVAAQSYAIAGVGGLTASTNVAKPSGTVTGDLLVVIGNTNIAAATLSCPGFTMNQISGTGMWWGWKITDGSEGSTFTFTRSSSPTAPLYVCLTRLTGFDPANPVSVYSGVWATSGTTGASIDAPGVTSPGVGLLMSFATRSNAVSPTVTYPSGLTSFINAPAGAGCAVYAATTQVSSGATGNKTWGFTGTGSNAGYAVGNIVVNEAPVVKHGTASGSFTFSGTAAGRRKLQGSSSGSFSFSGSAVGHKRSRSISTGSFSFTGGATGSKDPRGSVSGSCSWSGSSTGHRKPRATTTGGYSFSGPASGHTTRSGDAAGSYIFGGSTSGHRVQSGDASGSSSWSGSSIGHLEPRASASGDYQWTGLAVANDLPHGQALGSMGWSGAASGHLDRAGIVDGSATWSGFAQGSKDVSGEASGSLLWGGSVVGHRRQRASIVGSWSLLGSASGTRRPRASASTEQSWSGVASGTRDPIGSALDQVVWTGYAHGDNNIQLPTPPERIFEARAESRVAVMDVEVRVANFPTESRTF